MGVSDPMDKPNQPPASAPSDGSKKSSGIVDGVVHGVKEAIDTQKKRATTNESGDGGLSKVRRMQWINKRNPPQLRSPIWRTVPLMAPIETVEDDKGSSSPSTTGSTKKGGIAKSIIDAVDKQIKPAGKDYRPL
jgi:hypothetical protein